MSINILSWNCRGARAKPFPGRLKDVLKGHLVHILILCETRVSGSRVDRIMSKLGFNNWIRIEATGYAGGIWAMWNREEVTIHYIKSSTQALHVQGALVTNPKPFYLSCVYGELLPSLKGELWEDLIRLSSSITIPWLVIGDFNAYLSGADKKGGGPPNYLSMKSFEECINTAGLIDIEVVSDHFTWERGLLKERID